MKILFDHNLSPKLIHRLADLFPHSNHVYHLGLDQVEDRQIWQYAKANDLVVLKRKGCRKISR